MTLQTSVSKDALVSHDRIKDVLHRILRQHVIVSRRFSVEQLAAESRVSVDTIRSYMLNDPAARKEPCTSYALSLVAVLGEDAVNALLAVIHYGGATPLDSAEEHRPMEIVAKSMTNLAIIAEAAKDNRFDHVERPGVTTAADAIIAEMLPLSSAGRAA